MQLFLSSSWASWYRCINIIYKENNFKNWFACFQSLLVNIPIMSINTYQIISIIYSKNVRYCPMYRVTLRTIACWSSDVRAEDRAPISSTKKWKKTNQHDQVNKAFRKD